MPPDASADVVAPASDSPPPAPSRWRVGLGRALVIVDWSARIATVALLLLTGWTTYSGLRTLGGDRTSHPDAATLATVDQSAAPSLSLADRWRFADGRRLIERERVTREQLDRLLAEDAATRTAAALKANGADHRSPPTPAGGSALASALTASLALPNWPARSHSPWRLERGGLVAWGSGSDDERNDGGLTANVAIASPVDGVWTIWRLKESTDPSAARPTLLPFPPAGHCVASQFDEHDRATLEMVSLAGAESPEAIADWATLEALWRAAGWSVETPSHDADAARHCTRAADVVWAHALQQNLIVVSRSEERIR